MRRRAALTTRGDNDLRTAHRARRAAGVMLMLAIAAVASGCREDASAAEAARRGGADAAMIPPPALKYSRPVRAIAVRIAMLVSERPVMLQ